MRWWTWDTGARTFYCGEFQTYRSRQNRRRDPQQHQHQTIPLHPQPLWGRESAAGWRCWAGGTGSVDPKRLELPLGCGTP